MPYSVLHKEGGGLHFVTIRGQVKVPIATETFLLSYLDIYYGHAEPMGILHAYTLKKR